MTNNDQRRDEQRRAAVAETAVELEKLLRAIEQEPVPERLLELAVRLQEALRRRDAAEGTGVWEGSQPSQGSNG